MANRLVRRRKAPKPAAKVRVCPYGDDWVYRNRESRNATVSVVYRTGRALGGGNLLSFQEVDVRYSYDWDTGRRIVKNREDIGKTSLSVHTGVRKEFWPFNMLGYHEPNVVNETSRITKPSARRRNRRR